MAVNPSLQRWREQNREKLRAYDREWKKRNRAKSNKGEKNVKLKKAYNISLKDYEERLEQQNHVCAICKQPEKKISNGKLVHLAVDHDHFTGEVRGLLCAACNLAVGWAEKLQRFPEVWEYLKGAY